MKPEPFNVDCTPEIAGLGDLSRADLAERWVELHGSSPLKTMTKGLLARGHCQSNGRELQNALYKDVQAINSRHSAKAEARFCLKMSRRLR